MRYLLLLAVWYLGFWSASSAQTLTSSPTFKVGAVLPLSGDSASTGQFAAAALRASAETLRARGINLDLTILDSESSAVYAAARANTLVSAGVHALICCETAQVAAQLAPAAAAAGLPVLSLAPVDSTEPLVFSLAVDDTQVLAKLALSPPQQPLALLAPADALGDRASRALQELSLGVIRYPAGQTPLTPEALLAATLEPQSIVIWDDAAGTVQAAKALTARGYTGVRVVRAEVWDELDALSRAELTGAVSALSPAVLGFRLPDTHPSKRKVSSFLRALSGTLATANLEQLTTAASAWDAAQLLGAAAEQVLTYTDVTSELGNPGTRTEPSAAASTRASTAAVRGALGGAFSGLGPIVGAGGTYSFSGDFSANLASSVSADRARGLTPDSLVWGVWRGGRFLPYP